MEEKNIVAIDLGSTKIAITVANVNGNDVQVTYYKERPSAGIRYSSVYNILHATEPVSRIIREAEEALDIRINQVVVGMPKYPVRQESNSVVVNDRGEDCDITAENIAELKSYAEDSYPIEDPSKEAIYGVVAQSFSDSENFQIIEDDIIGMVSDVLEGHFKIFLGKKSNLKKIDTVMTKTGICARKKYFTAETTAKAVLTDAEMENGVALIDFGGGSTSVTIYHGKVMRHYASIPFGGKNITDDIKSECQISERLAENIKLAYGACMPEKLQSLSEKVLQIISNNNEPSKQITVKYLSEIITARIEEIIMAILYEIEESGFGDMLKSGLVITGGVAETANLSNFIYELSGYRVRTGYPKGQFSTVGCNGIKDPSAATSVGLILAAKDELGINCAQSFKPSTHSVVIEEDEPVITSEEPSVMTLNDIKPVEEEDMEVLQSNAPAEEKTEKKSIWNGINIFWSRTKKKAEEAAAKTGEMLDDLRNEEV
jgi:cell division protein FtsA